MMWGYVGHIRIHNVWGGGLNKENQMAKET